MLCWRPHVRHVVEHVVKHVVGHVVGHVAGHVVGHVVEHEGLYITNQQLQLQNLETEIVSFSCDPTLKQNIKNAPLYFPKYNG